MTMRNRNFLAGDRVYLRPLIEEDCEGAYISWLNDDEVCYGNSHHVFPFTHEAALDYIRHSRSTKEELVLAIVVKKGDAHIGNIALQRIHPVYRSAELSVIIGDKNSWGKGYGKEAATLLCDHGFFSMNLQRIGCATFENNTAMQKLALAIGMKEEGRRRHAAFKAGQYLDIIEFGILDHEYKQKRSEWGIS